MPLDSATDLIDLLQSLGLLEPEQEAELKQDPQQRFPEPRALARELVHRGWLAPFQINQLFQGRSSQLQLGSYLLLERLGTGSLGQVFKARGQSDKKLVVLKVIRKDLLTTEDEVQRFQEEIKTAAGLTHPHV